MTIDHLSFSQHPPEPPQINTDLEKFPHGEKSFTEQHTDNISKTRKNLLARRLRFTTLLVS